LISEGKTVGVALQTANRLLAENDIATSSLDARILLQEACGFSRTEIIAREKELIASEALARFNTLLGRRLAGEPVHRIIGRVEFYGREFFVGEETLVPRPETELLIDTVLAHFTQTGEQLKILDLGTGTGIIAITLALEIERSWVCAVDISSEALATAQRNARQLDVRQRVIFSQSDFFNDVEGTFEIIASNPPYICSDEIASLQKEVKHYDPRLALDGGVDGIDCYRRILGEAGNYLTPDGKVVLEIGHDQAEQVEGLALSLDFELIEVRQDLSGLDRVVVLQAVSC